MKLEGASIDALIESLTALLGYTGMLDPHTMSDEQVADYDELLLKAQELLDMIHRMEEG